MSSKEKIFESIHKNLPKNKVAYPEVPTFLTPGKNLLETFVANAIVTGSKPYQVKSLSEAKSIAAKTYPDAKVICSAAPEWPGNKDLSTVKNPHDLNDVDVAIVRAEFGVAENGMVWLTNKDLKINSLAFLAQHIIVLLDPDHITENLNSAYKNLNLTSSAYGVFVMGPSATADIGAVLVRGAQGPRTLTLFLLPAINTNNEY